MFVPLALVPCQYHVTPEGGLPLKEIVLEPQVFEETIGVGGAVGGVQLVTVIVVCARIPASATNIR
jgi:hypothetical protein